MRQWLRDRVDRFFGAGQAALTVPAMDGAFLPNQALDEAHGLPLPEADNLILSGSACLASSGDAILSFDPHSIDRPPETRHRLDGRITAMAGTPDGALAAAAESGRVAILAGKHAGHTVDRLGTLPLTCVTALLWLDADTLIVAIGSPANAASQWKKDLMEGGRSGSVWRVPLAGGEPVSLARDLAWPYGLLPSPDGRTVLVSESWLHRIVRIDAGSPSVPHIVVDDLPGYPARLSAEADGGAWLAIFAPRNQLVEFVLREPKYRIRMMATIAPEFWIAPALRSRDSFLEPLQGGGVRQLGLLKPWAPTRSYGLIASLDPDGQPRASLHSRADGARHGITSCLRVGRHLLAASRGGGEILVCEVDPT